MSLEKLFEPITIGNCTLKNRIAMAPMNMGYTGPEGYVSDHTLAWFATRARGGFGLIITECFVVNPHRWRGSDSLNPALFSDRRYFRFVSELVELVHSYDGCKIFINRDEVPVSQMVARCKQLATGRAMQMIFFTAEDNVNYENVMKILDLVHEGGLTNVAVLTESIATDSLVQ